MSKLDEVSHEMLVLMLPRVSSRVSGFPLASPSLWGKLQNLSFSKVSKQVVMSFCVAGAALCDIPTCLITCRKSFLCGRRNTFASSSQDELQFSWQEQHFGDLSVVILRGKRSTLEVWCCMFLRIDANM